MVWRFVFGLCSKIQNKCSYSEKIFCFDDGFPQRFVENLIEEDSDGDYSLSFRDSQDTLLLCHCALEAEDSKISAYFALLLEGEFQESYENLYDYAAVLNILEHTGSCSEVKIDVSGCGIGDKQLISLTKILSKTDKNLHVEELNFNQNNISDKGIAELFYQAQVSLSTISDLSLEENKLTNNFMLPLVKTQCKTLTNLSLSGNLLGVSGLQSLQLAIDSDCLKATTDLDLSNTFTDEADINGSLLEALLCSIALHCPELKYLELSKNNLGVYGGAAVGQSLPLLTKRPAKLTLTLNKVNFDCQSMVSFSSSFISSEIEVYKKSDRYSCTLDLDDNPIGVCGLFELFKIFGSKVCKVTDLQLQSIITQAKTCACDYNFQNINKLKSKSCCSILTDLSLNRNRSSDGMCIIVLNSAIQAGMLGKLKYLNLKETFTEDIHRNGELLASLLPSIVYHCHQLEDLDLSENNFDVPGMSAIGKSLLGLISHQKLSSVDLAKTSISLEAIKCLTSNVTKSIHKSNFIKCNKFDLDLRDNPLGLSGIFIIFEIIRSGVYPIETLYLDNVTQSFQGLLNCQKLYCDFRNETITYIFLRKNNFNGHAATILATFIQTCSSLESFTCSKCSLTSADIIEVLVLLKQHNRIYSKLEDLDLCDNFIQDNGVIALSEELPYLFPNLEYLDVDGNNLSDAVKTTLVKSLKKQGELSSAWKQLINEICDNYRNVLGNTHETDGTQSMSISNNDKYDCCSKNYESKDLNKVDKPLTLLRKVPSRKTILSKLIQRQHQYLKRLKNLMTDGNTADILCMRLFLIGPPGVGKTITLKRLNKEIKNISTPETVCQSAVPVNNQVQAFVSEDVAKLLSSEPTTQEQTATSPNQGFMIKPHLQKLIETGKISTFVGNVFLTINEIGDNPGFLEMLPALSTGPAMHLVFIDLSKELGKPYGTFFSQNTTPANVMISQILSAIAGMSDISRDSVFKNAPFFSKKFERFQHISPVVTLIGTHKDQLKNPEKEIKTIDASFKKSGHKYERVLKSPINSSLFLVDNYAGSEESDIGQIREFMNDVICTQFKEAILPIRPKWLIFGTVLREQFKIVKMEDCLKIGKALEMDKSEVEFCLWYLHCIGTLMYYPSIFDDMDNWFNNHIVCSLSTIFDSVHQLIVATLCTIHTKDYVDDESQIIKKGQFSIEIIEKYCISEEIAQKIRQEEIIPPRQLVILLNYVNLLAPISHKEADGRERITYLMPPVLDCASPEELTTSAVPDHNTPDSLLLSFSCGYVPTSTFCGLITKLVSLGPSGIFGFDWDLVEDGVKRNCVSFYVDYTNKITLICRDRCYEIRVSRGASRIFLHELCSHVLASVLYILKKLYQELNLQISFYCPCPKHKNSKDTNNMCTLDDNQKVHFICGTRACQVTLTEYQRVWLGKPVVVGQNARLEVLQDPKDFFFHWTKDGSNSQIEISGNKGNTLTFENVCEEDLGYYRCEVEEAGGVAFTIYKTLYRNELNEGSYLTQGQQIETHTSCQGLTLWDLTKNLKEARSKWFDLGIELDIDLPTLQGIRTRHHRVVDDCFQDMLSHWLRRSSPPPTKEALISALRSPVIRRMDLARLIEEGSDFTKAVVTITMKEVRRLTWEVRKDWKNLGGELGVDEGDLEVIRKSFHDIDDCYTDMLSHWLQRPDPPPSWSELVEALKTSVIGRGDIADTIQEKYLK